MLKIKFCITGTDYILKYIQFNRFRNAVTCISLGPVSCSFSSVAVQLFTLKFCYDTAVCRNDRVCVLHKTNIVVLPHLVSDGEKLPEWQVCYFVLLHYSFFITFQKLWWFMHVLNPQRPKIGYKVNLLWNTFDYFDTDPKK